jgi:hypothetical protein
MGVTNTCGPSIREAKKILWGLGKKVRKVMNERTIAYSYPVVSLDSPEFLKDFADANPDIVVDLTSDIYSATRYLNIVYGLGFSGHWCMREDIELALDVEERVHSLHQNPHHSDIMMRIWKARSSNLLTTH